MTAGGDQRVMSRRMARERRTIAAMIALRTYDFELDDQVITSSFAGASGAAFSIRGEYLARFGAIVGTGLSYVHDRGFSAVLRYRGDFRDQQTAHGVLGEVRYAF